MFNFRNRNKNKIKDNKCKDNNGDNYYYENILSKKIDKLNKILLKSNILEITTLIGNKKQLLLRNFIAGISRGVGIGIGVTVVTALLIILLQKIITLNIPIISEYISDIIDIVTKTKLY